MNIKVDFDNIVVKEDKNDFNVKVLMLKGEKGDAGSGEENVIEEVQVNGTALTVTNKAVNVPVPIVDSTLSSSSTNPVQNKIIYTALSNKADTSALNNYYLKSETDNLLDDKLDNSALDDYYTKQQSDSKYETIASHNADINSLNSQISGLASGSPLVASSTSEMTDTTRVYVNTSDGYWYYYNGESWEQGGIYQSSENIDELIEQNNQIIDSIEKILNGNDVTNNKFIEMQYGELNVNGRSIYNPYPSTTNICSTAYFPAGTTIGFDDTIYKIMVVEFDNNVYTDYFGFYTTSPCTIPKMGDKQFAIQLRRKDNANISSLENQCYIIETIKNKNLTYNKLNDNFINYEWGEYTLPTGFSFNIPVRIFNDGKSFITNFNKEDYKNSNGTIRYVSKNGVMGNNGLIKEKPTTIQRAYSLSSNGDTIVLLDGIYDIQDLDWGYVVVQKSLNIIGENNVVIYSGFLNNTFTSHSTYLNVLQITKNNIVDVIETYNNKIFEYKKLTSISDVNDTIGSYYVDGSTVYLNPLISSDNICLCQRNNDILNIDNDLNNLNLYIENITLIGKSGGIIVNKKNTSNSLQVTFNNVKTLYCGDANNDSFQIYGGNVIFNNCEASYSYKDGFNYNGVNKASTSVVCNVLEINSTGANNGRGKSSETMNGSTAHNGAKILRINGLYYDNYGVNVADVQEDTKSVNLGCKAFYSSAPNRNQNFSAQQDGTDMWLDGCIGLGANYDINCVSNCNMYLNRCCIGQTTGAGNIEIINPINKDVYILEELSNLNKKTDYSTKV